MKTRIILLSVLFLIIFCIPCFARWNPDRCRFLVSGFDIIEGKSFISNNSNSTMVAEITNNFGEDVYLFDGKILSASCDFGTFPVQDIESECNICFSYSDYPYCISPEQKTFSAPFNDQITLLWDANLRDGLSSVDAVLFPQGESRIISIGCNNVDNLENCGKFLFEISMNYSFSNLRNHSKVIIGDIYKTVRESSTFEGVEKEIRDEEFKKFKKGNLKFLPLLLTILLLIGCIICFFLTKKEDKKWIIKKVIFVLVILIVLILLYYFIFVFNMGIMNPT